jgi:predicted Zn-dependent peptidase
MKPEMKDQVLDFIEKEFKNMESNVTSEELAKVVEYLLKDYNEGKEENSFWQGKMAGYGLNGVDTYTGVDDLYKSFTPADVQDYMKRLNAQNYRVFLLEPAN